jgi:hypothetical protein
MAHIKTKKILIFLLIQEKSIEANERIAYKIETLINENAQLRKQLDILFEKIDC